MYYTGDACPKQRGVPARMNYDHYPERIAYKFGVLLVKWPLPMFCAPGNMNSLANIRLLINSFEHDVTQFHALSDEEWATWGQAHEKGEAPAAVTHFVAAPALLDATAGDREEAAHTPAESDVSTGTGATPAPAAASPSPSSVGAAPTAASEQTPAGEVTPPPQPIAFQFVDGTATAKVAALQVKRRARKPRADKGTTRKARAEPQGAEAGAEFIMN